MEGIVHAGITVSNLEESIKFYRDILGLKLVKTEPPKATRGQRLGVPGAEIQIAVFEFNDCNDSLELIEYLKPESEFKKGLPVNAIGQVHVAFRVKNVLSVIERLNSNGVEFIGGNIPETIEDGPLQGWKWIYFKDPDGTNLELIQES